MNLPSRREVRRASINMRLVLFGGFGVVMGVLLLVVGLIDFIKVNQFLQSSVAVNGVISDTFITYHKDSNGDTFPDFNLQYTYLVNGASMSDSQEVSRELYEQSAAGQGIVVYYLRDQPSSTRIDAAGSLGAPRAMIFIGVGALIGGAIFLFFAYRNVIG